MVLKNAPLVLFLSISLAACDLAQGIFKGGFIVGLLVAIVVITLIVKMFGRRGKA